MTSHIPMTNHVTGNAMQETGGVTHHTASGMYVRLHPYMNVCMYACMLCVYIIYIYTHTYISQHYSISDIIFIHINTCMHTYMHIYIYVGVRMCLINTCINKHNTYIGRLMYMYIHR